MNSSYQRADRISDLIKREVADVLSREVKDPRLSFVTITRVVMTRDLKVARIYFSTIYEGEEFKAILKGLKSASGFVQRKLASRINLRNTPHISFVYDGLFESGTRMDMILRGIEQELEEKNGE